MKNPELKPYMELLAELSATRITEENRKAVILTLAANHDVDLDVVVAAVDAAYNVRVNGFPRTDAIRLLLGLEFFLQSREVTMEEPELRSPIAQIASYLHRYL